METFGAIPIWWMYFFNQFYNVLSIYVQTIACRDMRLIFVCISSMDFKLFSLLSLHCCCTSKVLFIWSRKYIFFFQ